MSTRRRLSQLLITSHMGLVLLFAVLLIATGIGTLRSATLAQARSEADRTVAESRRRLQEWQRELQVASDLLAEQPTLRFYLRRGQFSKARKLVEDFHGTSDIEFIRVRLADRTIAQVGPVPPGFDSGLLFDQRGVAWRVGERGIPGMPDASIVVAERLGERLSDRPTTDLVTVRLQPPLRVLPRKEDTLDNALFIVSRTGEPHTYESIPGTAAVSVAALRDGGGQISAILSARVQQTWVMHRLLEWLATFGVASLLTGGLAFALAILLAGRIARPFAQLAGDAERLGQGDLTTPIPPPKTFLSEPVALATSLETMRQQVSALTLSERRQREELDAVLDGVDEGIVGVDPDQRIHYANRQFLELVGKERDDVLGQTVSSILLPVGGQDAPADDVLAGLGRFTPVGKMRPLTVRRLPATGDRQIVVVRDENAIEAGRGMRDRILANLSHEFQTPLSAQVASIELLREHLRTTPDKVALQLADAQFRGTIRLSQLVDNLLDSVRIESGEMRLRRQHVDLTSIVGDAMELMRPLIEQRDQRFVSNLPEGPALMADGPRLLSVVVNLLANANKFAPDQTSLWVDVQWQSDEVTVWVEDEGPGLPATSSTSDLFAPFRRSPHEEPSERGSGLGLAIVHAIVAAHGGRVIVAAPLQHRGARIGIALPLESNT